MANTLKSAILLEESIALGLSAIENVEFSANEKSIVDSMSNKLTTEQKETFSQKFDKWKQKCESPENSMHSNPKFFTTLEEYLDFKTFCELNGQKVWPLLFKKFDDRELIAMIATEDIVMQKNIDILKKIKQENKLKSATTSGAAIVRTQEGNTMKFIKELLKSTTVISKNSSDGISYSNSDEFEIFPNPVSSSSQISFGLNKEAKVTISIIDLNGRVISMPINNEPLQTGDYQYNLNLEEGSKGVYLVKLVINGNVNIKKIIIE